MTSTKKTKAAKPVESSTDDAAIPANADIPEKAKSSLTNLLKEALATKNKNQQLQKNTKKIEKGQKIGMPPRGTRRSMGKR
jgi:hypothetical protein